MLLQRQCQNDQQDFVTSGLSIRAGHQLVTLFASVPLTSEHWEPLAEGELVAVARGRFTARQLAHESPIFYDQTIDQSALS
jgi:predicted glutamine amidotransferase